MIGMAQANAFLAHESCPVSYYVPTSTLNWSARYLSHRF
jgi:hypothetical protein